MATMLNGFSKYKHLLLMVLYPFVGLGFVYCEHVVNKTVYLMDFPAIDHVLPFVPFMIWPYIFWYFFVAFPFFWYALRSGPSFTRFTWYIYGAMVSTYVIYLFFWNGEDLRPPLAGLQGMDINVIRWVYAHDSPQNVNPSIHVMDTMGVWFTLSRDQLFQKHRWPVVVVAILSVTIIASTLLVKQHSILDVTGGLLWSALWYGLIYSRWSPFFRSGRFTVPNTLIDQR